MADGYTIIAGAGVIDPSRADATDRDIVIRNGVVDALLPPSGATIDGRNIDGSGFYVLPGLVNAHTHSHNALVKGVGDAWTLELLLNYGPALNSRRRPEDHYWTALLNGVEMLQSGVTDAYDLVIHQPAPTVESLEAVVLAYRDLGMRAVVAPAIADLPFYDIVPGLKESLPEDLRREIEALEPAPGARILSNVRKALHSIEVDDRVRFGVAPTIPAQCSDPFLLACARLAEEFDVGLHTHLAESRVQAVEGFRRYGVSLTRHLHDLDLLRTGFVAAHGVWLDDDDVDMLAASGGILAHNPASNLRLSSGVAPARRYLDRGLEIALGTDGSASSDNQNIFEAMRLASHLSRLWSSDPDAWLSSRSVLDAAIRGGRRACGTPAPTRPTVEPGMPADLVLLRRDSIHLTPATDLPSQLVNSETGRAVDTVLVDGEVVLLGGRPVNVDVDRVRAEAASAYERLRRVNAAEFEFARRLTPYIVQACGDLASSPLPIDRTMSARGQVREPGLT